jgi:hypothetical protein
MFLVGLSCVVGGYVLGLVTDSRARKLLSEIKSAVIRIEARVERTGLALESGAAGVAKAAGTSTGKS